MQIMRISFCNVIADRSGGWLLARYDCPFAEARNPMESQVCSTTDCGFAARLPLGLVRLFAFFIRTIVFFPGMFLLFTFCDSDLVLTTWFRWLCAMSHVLEASTTHEKYKDTCKHISINEMIPRTYTRQQVLNTKHIRAIEEQTESALILRVPLQEG